MNIHSQYWLIRLILYVGSVLLLLLNMGLASSDNAEVIGWNQKPASPDKACQTQSLFVDQVEAGWVHFVTPRREFRLPQLFFATLPQEGHFLKFTICPDRSADQIKQAQIRRQIESLLRPSAQNPS
jgi:hypothetical protein